MTYHVPKLSEEASRYATGCRSTRLCSAKGEVLYIIHKVTNVTEPVTERQRGEQNEALAVELAAANSKLLSVNKQLAHINSDLDNFIFTASHDLRGPIAIIEGLLQLLTDNFLLKSMDAEETQHVLALMQEAVECFKRTISHLTEITKLQKENTPYASPVNLAAVLADVQLNLGPAIRATQAQLEIDVTACPTIHFAEKNLRSILYNLLSNAVKYHSPERALIVRVRCRETAGHQVLSVQDNGLGMDLPQEHKLFAMFRRLHDHVEGSGIGLYMVKKIIENAGGSIEVWGKGRNSPSISGETHDPLPRYRLIILYAYNDMTKIACTLLVDDDETVNYLNKSLFKRLGATEQLLVARNGLEALSLINRNCPGQDCSSLILLDINMPIMDGFEFLEQYDYILQLDVSKLTAGEVSQCLHYLYHIPKRNAEIERSSAGIKGKLNERLTELRKEKESLR